MIRRAFRLVRYSLPLALFRTFFAIDLPLALFRTFFPALSVATSHTRASEANLGRRIRRGDSSLCACGSFGATSPNAEAGRSMTTRAIGTLVDIGAVPTAAAATTAARSFRGQIFNEPEATLLQHKHAPG